MTFEDLNNHLGNEDYTIIHSFLTKYGRENQNKFEPQESLLRLFCSLNLFTNAWNIDGEEIDITKYLMTSSYFSKGEIELNQSTSYNDLKKTHLKDSGDKSDLSLILPSSSIIMATTSKNFEDYSGKGKNFDLNKIQNDFNKHYKNTRMHLRTLLVVRDKQELFNCIDRMTFSSLQSKKLLQQSLFLDWDDLNKMYRDLKKRNSLVMNDVVDKLMCKYVNGQYFSLLAQKHDAIQYYTERELKQLYKNVPDLFFIEVSFNHKIPFTKSEQLTLVRNIINGNTFEQDNIKVNQVHIRLKNKFGHSLKDVFNCNTVVNMDASHLSKNLPLVPGLYILNGTRFEIDQQNIPTTSQTTSNQQLIINFVFSNPSKTFQNIYKSFNTFHTQNGPNTIDICELTKTVCTLESSNIIIHETDIL